MEKQRPCDHQVVIPIKPVGENGRTNISLPSETIELTSSEILNKQLQTVYNGEIDPFTGTRLDTTERPAPSRIQELHVTWKRDILLKS